MSQPRDDRQDDLFRPSLEKIINLRHPLVRLAAEIDWHFLAGRFSSVCRLGPGQPPLSGLLSRGFEDQPRDFVGMGNQREMAGLHLDGLGAHPLGHEALKVRIDRAVIR